MADADTAPREIKVIWRSHWKKSNENS